MRRRRPYTAKTLSGAQTFARALSKQRDQTHRLLEQVYRRQEDFGLIVRGYVDGALRWEFFRGSNKNGEWIIGGMRHASEVGDHYGVPNLTDGVRRKLVELTIGIKP